MVLDVQNDSLLCNISLGDSRGSAVAGLSRTAHSVVAVCLGCILVLGSLYNSLVLIIFLKFEAVRTPINMILLNISVSDLLVCVFGTPFSFAASVSGGWLIGKQGCKWYGFCNSLLGIVSLVSLSMLSYERYLTVLKCTKVDASNYRKACICIVGSWIYSLFWTMPPLFGWSSYGLESSGTTCSVVWHSRSQNNVSYIVCLFMFCLVLPLLIMIYSYGHIVKVIRGEPVTSLRHEVEITILKAEPTIVGSWMYSLFWTMPPLFEWSSYGLESSGTTCSVVWHSRSQNNVSYIVCLFLFCLVVPLLIMIYSYGHIVKVIRGEPVTSLRHEVEITILKAEPTIVGSWMYSLFWTMPPLFEWSSYGLESSGTTCSVVWHSRSQNNVSYIVCLFLFCLVVPLLIMIYSYGHIVKVIRGMCRINLTTAQKREHHLLFMVASMVTCYLFCWMPYGLVSLITTFGNPGIISPTISIIPSILAKSSTFINPLIYIFMNKQFYRCFVALLKCESEPHDSDITFNSRHSKELQNKENGKIQSSFHQAPSRNDTMSSAGKQQKLTLVVHYIDYR